MENPEEILPEILATLFTTSSPATELESLKLIHKQLRSLSSIHNRNASDFDLKFTLSSLEGNPYQDVSIEVLCKTQNLLNKFTCYLLERRFGWSESNQETGGRRVRRMSCTGVTLEASDGQQKAFINDLIDSLIQWLIHQKITESLLKAFEYTLKQVTNMPVVRNRAVVHIMDWLKENRENLKTCLSCATILVLIQMSLTDVWSAIRNSCSKHLGHITPYLPLQYQEELFNQLVTICNCPKSSWQAKEGAIMGINAMVHHYQDKTDVNFGLEEEYKKCPPPEYISSQIIDVVFTLLSNPQLTIRENAAKAISGYISSADMKEALSTFEQVLTLLRNDVLVSDQVHTVILPIELLDDYAAEGFLNVSLFILKVLPLKVLLSRWSQYVSTFLLYLSHHASTVRQAASNIFKYLVAKSSHCVVLVKLVLQSLIQDWEPDITHLTIPHDHHHSLLSQGSTIPSVNSANGLPLLQAWESREGRLFAYELILKYLLKNHWLYTFGPAGAGYIEKYQTTETEADGRGDGITGNGSHMLYKSHTIDAGQESISRKLQYSKSEKSMFYGSQHQNGTVERSHRHTHSLSESLESPYNVNGSSTPIESSCNHGSEEVFHNGPSQLDTTYSILMQIQVLERSNKKKNQKNCQHYMHSTSLEEVEKLLKNSQQNNSKIEELLKKDVHVVDVDFLSNILITILHQTLQCMSDNQWELKRMSKQVLPCLAEVIRWYDINILENIWKAYLPKKTCLLTYAASVMLKESVVHCVKLLPLLQKPPNAWQDHDMCKRVISKIVSSVTVNIQSYLPYIDILLQRPVFDRLSVVSASTIIAAHSYFNIPNDQRFSQIATLLSFWKLLFCFSHPNTRISKELLQGADIRLFSSPFEGYLSCCLVKPETKLQCAKQVEKFFVTEVHHGIKPFLLSLPVESSSLMLPVIAHYTGLFIDNNHVCKTMCDCLNTLGSKITDFVSGLTDQQQMQGCLKCIHLTLKELAAIITMKTADLHMVQKILSAYLVLCKVINPTRHLRIILVAICSRVSDNVYFNMEHSPRQDDDFNLLSNDIPMSGSPDCIDEWDGEDTAIMANSPGTFPECLTLNLSNNSGSLPSGRLSALSQHSDRGGNKSPADSDSENESSDWDSWDEEPEGHSALNETFFDFLQKLKKICSSGSIDSFTLEVKKLESREKSLIKGLLDW
ncbi:uncharacterized protein [Mytilus edulis]|uniref:uncharacterized protein isoform X4 n=1 Tax=Mytilus edulis TaxID=6550 RepID=UPI0039F0F781